ncbi:PF06114 domain protein (plasmid) [Neorhizobium galegae bv. officinalis bv. officinalis str. HAMBI 1141]|uniref:PF06114 domain protein n=1 Tax=Neorhizobium galegae bv. officinalis bv. officinalis str. HAMBI 1141 TaxID=1028801 RepID=A0A068TJT2_NEOGA|nr:ImmA/IrrE family metallo-endopeptidase [Neorhizobium galegae]CDN58359.1 PF06114 domain protein [Neorhizobium galegae bv. officinalis bv. officinalis str. HAMBI 1141]
MTIRPIRTEENYEKALERARQLMTAADQKSVDELEILQALIEKWERNNHAIANVSPAEAIRFRMAQSDMKPRDLIPYLGSKSRVSEILNGQRQLTVDQIRALNYHLNIPTSSLIGTIKHESASKTSSAANSVVERLRSLDVMAVSEDLRGFMARATASAPAVAMLRKSRTARTNAKTDFTALEAWCGAVMVKADAVKVKRATKVNYTSAARSIAKISARPDWATAIFDELNAMGIVLVILEHLPGTYLDGAAMCRSDGAPIIALTLRHDRIDNFWFTMMHEFAHVACHLSGENPVILDDLDVGSSEGIEAEADEFARNALIPKEIWEKHVSSDMETDELEALAEEAGIHQAIVAGRWQYEHSEYRKFSRLLGRGEPRRLFKS